MKYEGKTDRLLAESTWWRFPFHGINSRLHRPHYRFACLLWCMTCGVLLAGEKISVAGEAISAAVPEKASPKFWAFRRLQRPALPDIDRAADLSSPIDSFIEFRLAEQGIIGNPRADRRTLIRRAYFDLIGLPPDPAAVEAFLADDSPDAYERLIGELLDSPHYGERWGRHWLDVAGYAESNGYITDSGRPEAWKYRDYVIRAFNEDKPYDQFLTEQLAGDELSDWRNAQSWTPQMIEQLTATGFLRCTPDGTDNQTMFQVDKRWDRLLTQMEVALKATIGINFNCVRCHDSKFDPISQEEYYSLLAAFQPAYDPENWIAANNKYGVKWPVRFLYVGDRQSRDHFREQIELTAQRLQQNQLAKKRLQAIYFERWLLRQARREAMESPDRAELVAALETTPEQRTQDQNKLVIEFKAHNIADDKLMQQEFPELKERLSELKKAEQAYVEALKAIEPAERIWALWDVSAEKPPATHVLLRGDYTTPGNKVAPAVPAALDWDTDTLLSAKNAGPRHSTGRRHALAKWITDPRHPLTARVMVNRIWHHHFGRGIVESLDDFGAQGARPSHPQLLDWLAAEFIESGWSIKHMNRQIMLSQVYCQSSEFTQASAAVDPQNHLWWRRDMRRLEAEAIRDAMLVASNTLDSSLFGPSARVRQAEDGGWAVPQDNAGRFRRSIYLAHKRNRVLSLLRVFDAPDSQTNEPERFTSNVPLQSLSLMNNPFVHECAEAFAQRIRQEKPTRQEQIAHAFAIALGRPPNKQEVAVCERLIATLPDDSGWQEVCHGLITCNEFLYVN